MSELHPVPTSRQNRKRSGRNVFIQRGTFVEFKREEIEPSIPERFEKIVTNVS